MLLSDLLADRGWEPADVAAMLAERGVVGSKGKPISPNGVRMVAGRGMSVPAGWADALGVELEQPPTKLPPESGDGPAPAAGGRGSRRSERPPERPPDAMIVVEAGAAKRISGAYKFAGAALAAGSGSQGVAYVWADSSDKIAELWVEAAKENPWAARFVNMMQAGGPMGDLAAGHLYLAGATLYVLGASIPGGDSIFAKYSSHRPVVAERRAAPEPPADGAPDGAAAAPVG